VKGRTHTVAGTLGQAVEVETINTLNVAQQVESVTSEQFGMTPNPATDLDAPTAQATRPAEVTAALQSFDKFTKAQPDPLSENESAPRVQNNPASVVIRTVELQPCHTQPTHHVAS
jgi:hypothetical protein